MTEAVRAAIIVLLFIAAICLLIMVVRSRSRGNSGLSFSEAAKSNAPRGANAGATASAADGEATVRRRFLLFMGAVGVALGALFVKLWSMQVISGGKYANLAEANRITEYTTVAPRGRIYDRNGVELVGNRATFAILADATVQTNKAVMRRLSVVLGIPKESIVELAASQSEGAQADRLIAQDVPMRCAAFISEHPSAFPGVVVESRTVRTYPQGTLACHVLGYAGTISEAELEQEVDGIDYESGDTVGKDGAEAAFETYLQGDRGVKRVEINAAGDVVNTMDSIDPVQGSDVRLTIDVEVQKVAEEALLQAFSDAYEHRNWYANAGAIICMDCTNGEIIAMASAPVYDPSEFIGGVSFDTWEALTDDDSGYPLSNRCIAGQYPAASTFKGFTGLAGLEAGFADDESVWYCSGTWTGFGEAWPQKCWEHRGHGSIGFYNGIVRSCDTVFYEIAKRFYEDADSETALQDYLFSWGFGSTTGIELSGEQAGRVPTPEWKREYNVDAPESQPWQPGDLSNLIIGQGDILVTPLQICCGYAGIATGKIPKPVLLHSVTNREGTAVVAGADFQATALEPEFDEANIEIVRNALRGVVSDGSVSRVFSGLGVDTSGKTGTGEVAGKDDFSWYVGYGPTEDPKYVCVALIEQGGSGSTVAAPAVRSVLGRALGMEAEHVSGESTSER